ncbi:uncharacterized protein YALI1_D32342g [Yarrowia lipolytica]|uniref:Uncharacterized protein n=1 Tax=Yarrowia lipolytica TaxID=4952 RepID=A0A1D8NG35_YARLL|nr:hypothetical protein YALI1_D32342g [Yarrowia lipolytica]
MGLAEFDHDLISRFSRFSAPSHELTIPFETSIVGRINHLWQRSLRGTSEGADVESSTPTELEESVGAPLVLAHQHILRYVYVLCKPTCTDNYVIELHNRRDVGVSRRQAD